MILKIKENIWSIGALSVLALALLSSRGGIAALGPILKFIIPVATLIFVAKFAQKKLASRFQDLMRQHMGDGTLDPQKLADLMNSKNKKSRNDQQVIDLCPQCGSYLKPGHRCHK